ncbi:tRNA 2-thiouridine(34) synthase MnmA [Luteibaculum oceani]|uniref:tRNA-specific 2-thiouridylase MnmA n=1 Tax=Luteibaculum oceani TaxID=1294296 RepID=A0A5C6VA05_9FLAO|nr:tRNA 2-thiouridine(34) synthase MnmA [Luteibaculum oceani]TXC82057.1 tRNA 2-thiouridine(34) synthase MnmA [Luteibaculum oceani]
MKRVVVGLSGGVDSSVCAYLLKEQGYEVIGIFMRNWNDDSVILDDECPWVEDSNDALLVAEKLGIPFQVIDLSEIYKERIVDYMFAEYEAGRTPNPDVLCNREIKFDVFLDTALKLGADFVATGHYCQKTTTLAGNKEIHHLIAGADNNKDQSYFLCQLSQEQLSKALFPIGHLQKSEVRKIATEQGLVTANKKDSQGLCFIGKVKLPDFLQQQLKPKKGKVFAIDANKYEEKKAQQNGINPTFEAIPLNAEMGKEIGEHQGAHYYTIGQRKGLGIGGFKEPLFVIGTNTKTNEIYTGEGEEHPGLYRDGLIVPEKDVHWINPTYQIQEGQSLNCKARIRYRQPLQDVVIENKSGDLYYKFREAQRGITPGQFVACYLNEELIGSGVIQ